jgi:hypothetical protein
MTAPVREVWIIRDDTDMPCAYINEVDAMEDWGRAPESYVPAADLDAVTRRLEAAEAFIESIMERVLHEPQCGGLWNDGRGWHGQGNRPECKCGLDANLATYDAAKKEAPR